MTREELVQNADKQSYEYNTKYSEDHTLKDMLKRPQDFVEGTIENIVDLLKKKAYRDGLIDGALPREKQIQIDAEQIRALQKQNGELTDENERLKGDLELWESGACRAINLDKCSIVKELKAQIEKIKHYLDYDIPHDLINEATTKIWRMLK